MTFNLDEKILLGEISGKLDGVTQHLTRQDQQLAAIELKTDSRFDGIDTRLRSVEQKAAVAGAISGGAISVGLALIIEGVKLWIARGTGH